MSLSDSADYRCIVYDEYYDNSDVGLFRVYVTGQGPKVRSTQLTRSRDIL